MGKVNLTLTDIVGPVVIELNQIVVGILIFLENIYHVLILTYAIFTSI